LALTLGLTFEAAALLPQRSQFITALNNNIWFQHIKHWLRLFNRKGSCSFDSFGYKMKDVG